MYFQSVTSVMLCGREPWNVQCAGQYQTKRFQVGGSLYNTCFHTRVNIGCCIILTGYLAIGYLDN